MGDYLNELESTVLVSWVSQQDRNLVRKAIAEIRDLRQRLDDIHRAADRTRDITKEPTDG